MATLTRLNNGIGYWASTYNPYTAGDGAFYKYTNSAGYTVRVNSITVKMAALNGRVYGFGSDVTGHGEDFTMICYGKVGSTAYTSNSVKVTADIGTKTRPAGVRPNYENLTSTTTFTFTNFTLANNSTAYFYFKNPSAGVAVTSTVSVLSQDAADGTISVQRNVNKPSTPTIAFNSGLTTKTLYLVTNNDVTIYYSKDTNYASGTERVEYRKNAGTVTTGKSSGGQTAGSFTISKLNPGKNATVKIDARKYIDSTNYSGWSNNAVVYTYTDPSTPTLSSSSTIVKTGTGVTFNYTKDTNYKGSLTEKVQYKTSGSSTATDIVSSGGEKAGSFNLTINPGAGSSLKVYARKYLNTAKYTSGWSNEVLIKTYTQVSAPTVTLTQTTINGNQSWNVSWDTWSGNWSETAKYDIALLDSNNNVIYTAYSNQTGTSKTVSPNVTKLLANYDNTNIKLQVTRKHANVSDYTKSTSKTVKVIYRPTSKVTPSRLGLITDKSTVKPTYTYSGDGVCSGFLIKFKDQQTGSVVSTEYVSASSNKVTYTLPKSKFTPTHSYSLIITPYYLSGGNYYYNDNATNTIVDYLTYGLESTAPPTIIAPTGAGLWYGFIYKALIKMPTDRNVDYMPQASKLAYRYKDIELTVNGTVYKDSTHPELFSRDTTDLTHECYVIINMPEDTSRAGSNTISMRVEYDSGWGESVSRTYTIDQNYPEFAFVKGEYIMGDVHDRLYAVVHNMYMFAVSKNDSNIFNAKGTKIFAQNYGNLLRVLKAIYDFYNIYATEYVELDPDQVNALNDQLDFVADTIGKGQSLDIQDPNSNTEAVIQEFKTIYSLIGISFPDDSSGYNFYNPYTITDSKFVGIIIKSLGLAAFVYEMALRMLGIPTDPLFQKLSEIEDECEIDYGGGDDVEYNYASYPVTDDILEVLGTISIYEFTDDEITQILVALASIEDMSGMEPVTETTTFTNENETIDSHRISKMEAFAGIEE